MDGKIRQKYSEIPYNHFKQFNKQIIPELDRSAMSSILMQQTLKVKTMKISQNAENQMLQY